MSSSSPSWSRTLTTTDVATTYQTQLHPFRSRQSMSTNQQTPVGGPRLVTKLCVVGEAGEEDGSGASFLLFMRANVPHQTQDQSYPLFPGECRSSQIYPKPALWRLTSS